VRFWDSSALVPLLIDEPMSADARAAYQRDPAIWVWWGTEPECASAISRVEREGGMSTSSVMTAFERLTRFREEWTEVEPTGRLRDRSIRLLRVHPLRAVDALQLAAASHVNDGLPTPIPFVTLDDRLALAAEREGLAVVRFGTS
jgi:predicted nucleic acid-binding protein